SWLATLAARRSVRRSANRAAYLGLGAGVALALAGTALLLAMIHGPGFDPAAHVHPAIVSVLVWWVAVHVAVGALMQAYCIARLMAGRMSAQYDIDISNVALYWHFVAIEAGVTLALLALFAAA